MHTKQIVAARNNTNNNNGQDGNEKKKIETKENKHKMFKCSQRTLTEMYQKINAKEKRRPSIMWQCSLQCKCRKTQQIHFWSFSNRNACWLRDGRFDFSSVLCMLGIFLADRRYEFINEFGETVHASNVVDFYLSLSSEKSWCQWAPAKLEISPMIKYNLGAVKLKLSNTVP